jgi:hypothetical protein
VVVIGGIRSLILVDELSQVIQNIREILHEVHGVDSIQVQGGTGVVGGRSAAVEVAVDSTQVQGRSGVVGGRSIAVEVAVTEVKPMNIHAVAVKAVSPGSSSNGTASKFAEVQVSGQERVRSLLGGQQGHVQIKQVGRNWRTRGLLILNKLLLLLLLLLKHAVQLGHASAVAVSIEVKSGSSSSATLHPHTLGFGRSLLFLLFRTTLVSLGNVAAAVSLCEIVTEGLAAFLSAEERLSINPSARFEVALHEASMLTDILHHI